MTGERTESKAGKYSVTEVSNPSEVFAAYADHILGMDCMQAGEVIQSFCKDADLGGCAVATEDGVFRIGIFFEGEPVFWADNCGPRGARRPHVMRVGHAARFIPGVGFARHIQFQKTRAAKLLRWVRSLQAIAFCSTLSLLIAGVFWPGSVESLLFSYGASAIVFLALVPLGRSLSGRPQHTKTEVLEVREKAFKETSS